MSRPKPIPRTMETAIQIMSVKGFNKIIELIVIFRQKNCKSFISLFLICMFFVNEIVF